MSLLCLRSPTAPVQYSFSRVASRLYSNIHTMDTTLLLWIFLRYLAQGIWRPRIVAIAREVAFRFNTRSCSRPRNPVDWRYSKWQDTTLVNSPRRSRRALLLLHTEPTWQPTFIRNVYINMISFREQRTIKRYPDFPRWREDGAEGRWRAGGVQVVGRELGTRGQMLKGIDPCLRQG